MDSTSSSSSSGEEDAFFRGMLVAVFYVEWV
jgi:hypothetical protein